MNSHTADQEWKVWETKPDYGDLLFRRATGELPEMESAKALARLVKPLVKGGESILDVGCGAGHYYRSLRREITVPFSYTGVDATAHYVELARKAWRDERGLSFDLADIYTLPFADSAYDIVISCNLLLHLPSIKTPLRELVRVSRRNVVARTLVGDRSFQIKEVDSPTFEEGADVEEFNETGDPVRYNYYNIYSQSYVERLLERDPKVNQYQIKPDRDYDLASLSRDLSNQSAGNTTHLVGEWQVNGYILQPWQFISISVAESF